MLAPSTAVLSADSIHAAFNRLAAFYVQTYHVKDALIADERATGVSRRTIEAAIDHNADLALLADLCNMDKHGPLRRLRSGAAPKITALEGAGQPAGWQLRLHIEHAGRRLDGLDVAKASVDAWERELAAWGIS